VLVRASEGWKVQTRLQQSTSVSVLVRASEGGKMHTQAGRDQAPICVHSSIGHEREVLFWKKKRKLLPWLHGRWHARIGGQLSHRHHGITPVNLMADSSIYHIISSCIQIDNSCSLICCTQDGTRQRRSADCWRRTCPIQVF